MLDEPSTESMRQYDPNRVRKQKCATCPWRDGSPVEELRPQLAVTGILESNHFCHQEQIRGKDPTWLCRGTRNLQLRYFYEVGVLDEPTDEAWAKALEELRESA